MGDRGNIILRFDSTVNPSDIYLYTHWYGSKIPDILRAALSRRWRWDDPPYLGRIIADELSRACGQNGETGMGISTYETDNNNDIYIVDLDNQKVICKDKADKVWTFEEFITGA